MNKSKVFIVILITVSIICILSNTVFAGDWNAIYTRSSALDNEVGIITDALKYVGAACAVIMLVYMGIRFVLASPDGQADLKKELPLWLIGCALLFSTSLLSVVKDTVSDLSGTLSTGDINATVKQGGGVILGAFQAVGAACAVIILVYIGIKYVLESPDGKAVLKKRLPTYIVGAAFVFSAPQIAEIVINFAMGI